MNGRCAREPEILRAAEEDRWTDALRRHVDECLDCRTAASVAPWMAGFARISDREHILPDPSIVWLKAKLLQGNVAAARAARPLDFVQMLSYGVVAAGWAALLTWKWDAVKAWLVSFTPHAIVTSTATAQSSPLSMSFFTLIFVLASFTVLLAMHTILAEE